MTPKEIIFSPNAEREIKKLSKADKRHIWRVLEKMRDGEGRLDFEKIKAQPDFFRVKAANMRIVYYPLTPERVVLLLIRDRKNSYRGLGNLHTKLETAMRKLRMDSR